MTFVASPKSIAVGLVAGLASALLVLSPVGGSLLAVPLTMLVDLPLIIAGLGWGTASAIIGALAGTLALLAASPGLALYFTVFLAPPVVVGSHMVGLSREASAVGNAGGLASIEWYPLGRGLVAVSLLVVAGAVIICVVNGFDPSAITSERAHAFAEDYARAMTEAGDQSNVEQLTDLLTPTIATTLRLLPFAFAATWTLVAVLNFGLAIWITRKSGNLLRPKEDFAGIDIPRTVAATFVLALVIGFIGGIAGAIASAVAGAMAALLLVQGLAVMHTVTRPLSFRIPLMVLVYLFLGICGAPLILVGIAEPYARLRQRLTPRGPSSPQPPTPQQPQ